MRSAHRSCGCVAPSFSGLRRHVSLQDGTSTFNIERLVTVWDDIPFVKYVVVYFVFPYHFHACFSPSLPFLRLLLFLVEEISDHA